MCTHVPLWASLGLFPNWAAIKKNHKLLLEFMNPSLLCTDGCAFGYAYLGLRCMLRFCASVLCLRFVLKVCA
jgi:hypothetical protein